MENLMQQLVNFVEKTEYDDVPRVDVDEIKRLLLDSIGCAIGGLSLDRGKIAVELARRLGGQPESTIIGTGDRVLCTSAAFANGELLNAQDYDAITPGNHIPPMVIPAQLALGESVGASGKDLLLALALAQEIAERFISAEPTLWGDLSQPGPQIEWPSVHGYMSSIFGAVVGAGRLLKLDSEKMANAIGIAGYIAAPSTMRKWMDTTPVRMTKYGPAGWVGNGAVTAALLADLGYRGDTDIFKGEVGYWAFSACGEAKPELILKGLGTEWMCHQVSYKLFPCGHCIVDALELFSQIMEENDLKPEDVTDVHAMGSPVEQHSCWRHNELITEEDTQFNTPYLISCVAHGVKKADFVDRDTRNDPRILEFMRKVKTYTSEQELRDFEAEYRKNMVEGRLKRFAQVQVEAKGKTFKKTATYRRGSWRPEELRFKDEELIKKFTDNASRVLPLYKVEKASETVYGLEKLENTAELMKIISL